MNWVVGRTDGEWEVVGESEVRWREMPKVEV